MLDELPDRIRQSLRHDAAQLRRKALDRVVEIDVRIAPVQQFAKLIAEGRIALVLRRLSGLSIAFAALLMLSASAAVILPAFPVEPCTYHHISTKNASTSFTN